MFKKVSVRGVLDIGWGAGVVAAAHWVLPRVCVEPELGTEPGPAGSLGDSCLWCVQVPDLRQNFSLRPPKRACGQPRAGAWVTWWLREISPTPVKLAYSSMYAFFFFYSSNQVYKFLYSNLLHLSKKILFK